MTYNELLNQKEWWSKCNEILSRDHYTCKDCGCLGFHNGNNYAVLNETDAIDNIFNSWLIDGYTFSQFCSNLRNYDLDHFENIELQNTGTDSQTNFFSLHFRLFDKESKYFNHHPFGISYGDFISDVDCGKIGMDAIILYDVIKHNFQKEGHSWLYAFKFDKPLANKVYLSINGSNCYYPSVHKLLQGKYKISVNFGDMLVVLSIESTKDVIFKGLNVHHTYYIEGKKPWEYEDSALVTLCENCHKKRHEETPTPVYASDMSIIGLTMICPKCGGSGYLPQYTHVEHGICFKCNGEGVVMND